MSQARETKPAGTIRRKTENHDSNTERTNQTKPVDHHREVMIEATAQPPRSAKR